MPMKARDVAKALQRKGFEEARERDHIYYFFRHDGKRTGISTKISHNEKDLTDNLCKFMATQTKLTLAQFRKLIDCPLTQQEYVKHLISMGHLKSTATAQATPAASTGSSTAAASKK